MKILEEYREDYSKIVTIVKAEYLQNWRIKIQFDDGTEKTIDFKPFIEESNHPEIKKYLNETLFQDFDIVNGNLNWNDYDMIFPVWDLYQGKITS
ncbi:MAG: DUF2442 domain-containing protein [Bacteroidetes bacterium]|nr:DUF2442 domain-containing protein [Bacteroidota bacterium]